jgi:hypothetical protein
MNRAVPYRVRRRRADLTRFVVLMKADEVRAIDKFGVPNAPNRTEAIRQLLAAGLRVLAKPSAKSSSLERGRM